MTHGKKLLNPVSYGQRWTTRDDLVICECERFGFLVPSKLPLVPFLDLHSPAGETGGKHVPIVSEGFTMAGVMNTIVLERKAAESNHNGDKLV